MSIVRLGGNCIHLHGEGGETHTRDATGRWLQRRGHRSEFFLCTQICHDGWDESASREIDRFTAFAVSDDISADLELLKTEYLDLVYLDDRPSAPFEAIVEAMGREKSNAGGYAALESGTGARSGLRRPRNSCLREPWRRSQPWLQRSSRWRPHRLALWPEYVGFDGPRMETVGALQIPVFAHAADVNLGQCLYGDRDSTACLRRNWLERWDHPVNAVLVQRVRTFAKANGLTSREVNIAWIVNHTFPCIAIVPLPSLLTERSPEFERASQFRMNEADRTWLKRSLDKA